MNHFKNMRKSSGRNSPLGFIRPSFHCKSFPCTSLTICKYGSIVAFKDTFNYIIGTVFVDVFLKRIMTIGKVKSELFVDIFDFVDDEDFFSLFIYFNCLSESVMLFLRTQRSTSYSHSNFF